MGNGMLETSLHVLIADDSAFLRNRLARMITRISGVGHVHLAADTASALLTVRDQAVDLAILDIQMPGGSGIDALRTIKERSPSPIVIMLTNYPYPQYQQKCENLGADYFFSKSTNSTELIDLVARLAITKGNSNG